MPKSLPVEAIVLGAGLGRRLGRLTESRQKVLLEVGGRGPLLGHTVGLLAEAGVRSIGLNAHHRAEDMEAFAVEASKRTGLEIVVQVEPELLGSAGALRGFVPRLAPTFLLVYGDMLLDLPVGPLREIHRPTDAITLFVRSTLEPERHGVVVSDRDGRVSELVEKPSMWERPADGFIGVAVVSAEVAASVPEGFSDFASDLVPSLLSAGETVRAVDIGGGFLIDVGAPERLSIADDVVAAGAVSWRGWDSD